MDHTMVRDKQSAAGAALRIALTVAAAVLLPQLFHAVGAISGTGTALGAALLPMHIPVLLAGLLYGPVVGVAAGVLSPLLSAAVSDMPTAALLPFMVLELGVYGLTSGFLSRTGLHGFTKLLLAQLAGRAARALAVLTAIYLMGPAMSMYFRPLEGMEKVVSCDPGLRMKLPFAVLTAAIVLCGLFSDPIITLLAKLSAGVM